MLKKKSAKPRCYAGAALMVAGLAAGGQQASALTAREVMDNMSAQQRFAYISGVVEGLGFARWLADDRDDTGMRCIYDWYYDEEKESAVFNEQMDWLEKHPDQQVNVLMYALIREYCGEQGSGDG